MVVASSAKAAVAIASAKSRAEAADDWPAVTAAVDRTNVTAAVDIAVAAGKDRCDSLEDEIASLTSRLLSLRVTAKLA